ncbi:hypothetical protein BDW74DRAFT_175568 [Aspergillus multicolor]|uniref:uncharacterized protein n=1 Tax=Aspergillus multicolor TaxID=41759 RepID=UPI003CCE24E7
MRYQAGNMPRPCDIVFCFKPSQGKDIDTFAESFVQALEEQTKAERAKYPAKYMPPEAEDILINDEAAKRISRSVHKWRTSPMLDKGLRIPGDVYWSSNQATCTHTSNISEPQQPIGLKCDEEQDEEEDDGYSFSCSCPLPFKERRGAAFMRKRNHCGCYDFFQANRGAFLHIEVVKTLLLHGELDSILRACADPKINLRYRYWHSEGQCSCVAATLGWDMAYDLALDAYLVLNIINCMPEVWDCGPRKQKKNATPGGLRENDYRNTAMYQRMLGLVARDESTPATVLPHLDFFGIPDGHFSECCWFQEEVALKYPVFRKFVDCSDNPYREIDKRGFVEARDFPYGHLPFTRFLNFEETVPRLSSADDIARVSRMLYSKRLPTELVMPILKMANYDTPRRRLLIAHDPFHAQNRDQLNRYMELCWSLLVRYNLFAQEVGVNIDWKGLIFHALWRYVGTPPRWDLYRTRYCRDPKREEYLFLDSKGQTTHVACIHRDW